MCEPTTALVIGSAAVSTALGGASDIMGFLGQNQQAEANERAAREAARNSIQQVELQQQQAAQRASRSIFMADLEARRADALTRVSAGESGVSGASVDMILNDIERQRLQATTDEQMNLEAIHRQANMEKRGINATMQSRINAVPRGSGVGLGLSLGGRALGGFTSAYSNWPKPPSIG